MCVTRVISGAFSKQLGLFENKTLTIECRNYMRKEHTRIWQDIRENWVNGNLSDSANYFKKNNKAWGYSIVLAALRQHYDSLPNGVARSGDLQDLIEILKRVTNQ